MNNKGQALIESLIVGLILVSSFLFLIRFTLIAQQNTMVDEFIEQALICMAQKTRDCAANLKRQLKNLKFNAVSIQSSSIKNNFSISLNALTSFGRPMTKESELVLDLQVAK